MNETAAARAPVSISFVYQREDFANAFRAHQGTPARVAFDACVALALIGLGGWLWPAPGWTGWLGLVFAVVGAVFLLLLVAVPLVGPAIAVWGDPKKRKRYHLTFSDEGIHFRTQDIDSRLQWSMYRSALAHRHGYLLYHGPNAWTVIPARAFASDDDRRGFDEMITARIPRVGRR